MENKKIVVTFSNVSDCYKTGLLRYFPAISQPEGLPLKVKDANGKDWVFQFRFWPNNNSRMYVWEGVTPCIQAMQLHLVIQDSQTLKSGNDFSSPPEADCKITAKHLKGSMETRNLASTGTSRRKGGNLGSKNKRLRIDNEDSMELKLTWEEAQQLLCPSPNCVPDIVLVEGHEFEEYEVEQLTAKPYYIELIIPELQLALVLKLLWINKLLAVELIRNVTYQCVFLADVADHDRKHQYLESVHTLLLTKSVRTLNGLNVKIAQNGVDCLWMHSFHLDGPVLTIHGILKEFIDNYSLLIGNLIQDDNFAGAYYNSSDLPSKEDGVEYMMSSCSAAQELSLEQLAELIPSKTDFEISVQKHIANIHWSIVVFCLLNIQPPSGKGPKHKQTCTCNVCLTVKRRFRTLMLRREKRKSEKDAETSVKHQKKQPNLLLEKTQVGNKPSKTSTLVVNNSPTKPISKEGISDVALESKRLSPQIDLNIQPERRKSHRQNLRMAA
ncbi:hypothetical protein ZIOFF_038182 [Zingiber officinale]|uniref:Uncharacterized protein n=1 Tax=Zingiber officinale TaxID=94328 RepID=A0A8J5GG33_ZINOF|nr:hypothetical protein ZIOFF_038182 [Zingiber officinale]